jgi:hypothetical protein
VRSGFTAGADAAQAIVVDQVAKDRLDGALPYSPHALALPALLPGPGAAVRRIVGGAGELLATRRRGACGFQRALLAVAVGSPVDLPPAAIDVRVVFLERQRLARWAGVGIRFRVVGEALYLRFVLAEDWNPRRQAVLF